MSSNSIITADATPSSIRTTNTHETDDPVEYTDVDPNDETFSSRYFSLMSNNNDNNMYDDDDDDEDDYEDTDNDDDEDRVNSSEKEDFDEPMSSNNNKNETFHQNKGEKDENQRRRIRVQFRNYTPRDYALQKSVRKVPCHYLTMDHMYPRSTSSSQNNNNKNSKTAKSNEETNENRTIYFESHEQVTDYILKQLVNPVLDQANTFAESKDQSDAILELIPQKVNYDLKRDVTDRLQLLEKRTMKALAEILQEKLSLEQEQENDEEEDEEGDSDDNNDEESDEEE